jgi:7-cyano-7-deazaguanine synthase
MERAVSMGLSHPVVVETPFADKSKAEVIRLGESLGVKFELTLSCMQPVDGIHCGRCSKCRERLDAFRDAGVKDPATYAMTPPR